ncbi:MAG: cysteine hydrolase, partial [Candidatus Binatia bacterium]
MPAGPLTLPPTTALLMMECQRGVLDVSGKFAVLAERAAEKSLVAAIARMLVAARETSRTVVHCLALTRADGGGRTGNAPLLRMSGEGLTIGSERAAVVRGLEPVPADFVVGRLHGVSPFHGTELDAILRSRGVTTVIATGVSVNVGVTALVIEAVNHGYEVVLPTDAVAGVPAEYEAAQLKSSLRMLARLTTADEVCEALR